MLLSLSPSQISAATSQNQQFSNQQFSATEIAGDPPLYMVDIGDWKIVVLSPHTEQAISSLVNNGKITAHVNLQLHKRVYGNNYDIKRNYHLALWRDELTGLICFSIYESKATKVLYSSCTYESESTARLELVSKLAGQYAYDYLTKVENVTPTSSFEFIKTWHIYTVNGQTQQITLTTFALHNPEPTTLWPALHDLIVAVDLKYFTPQYYITKTTSGKPLRVTKTHNVRLLWETGWEQDTSGFNIFRATANDFTKAILVRFEPSITSGGGFGGKYSWVNQNIVEGSYYYWLQEVDIRGAKTLYPPVKIEARECILNFTC